MEISTRYTSFPLSSKIGLNMCRECEVNFKLLHLTWFSLSLKRKKSELFQHSHRYYWNQETFDICNLWKHYIIYAPCYYTIIDPWNYSLLVSTFISVGMTSALTQWFPLHQNPPCLYQEHRNSRRLFHSSILVPMTNMWTLLVRKCPEKSLLKSRHELPHVINMRKFQNILQYHPTRCTANVCPQ